MDEFEYKFSRKDPILVINTVKTLVERIRGFHFDNNKIEYEKYYKYLRGKCLQSDIIISTTATDGILLLCEGGEKGPVLNIEVLLNDFITSLQLQNISSVIHLIFHAMDKIDFSKYGIMFNQHPLITILKRDEKSWALILTNINNLLECNRNIKLQHKLQPFILYSLYDYEQKVNEMFQHELLKLYMESANETLFHKIMLFNKQHLLRTIRYCQPILKTNTSLLPSVIIVVHECIKHNLDASEGLLTLKRAAKDLKKSDVSIELCLLVDCIQIAPLIYLNDILEICVHMLSTCTYKNQVLYMLKSSLLKCKLNLPTYNRQTEKLMDYINKIMTTEIQNNSISDVSGYNLIFDVNTFIISEILKDSLLQNMNQLKDCPITLLSNLFNYLLSVLYESADAELIAAVLPTLIRCSEKDHLKNSQLLSVVLYKLASCYNPKINLPLIKTLSKLATLKENLPIILTTVKTFSVYLPKMQTLALVILYEIFCLDIRCFNYLQELLIKENKGSNEEVMDYEITKAYVLKELCRKNAHLEVYGSEFAGYISKILNSKRVGDNCLVQALALEGLKYLCRNDIIDVGSAWDNLSVHYEHDSRSDVVISLCEMLTEIANETSTDVKHEQLVLNVVEKLWSYTMYDDLRIVKSAYNALGHFTLEQVSVGLPAQYALGSCNAFGNIPGASWINLLLKCRKEELEFASDFLKTFIIFEVKNFGNSIYNVDGRGEPERLELPGYSVLAAVFDHVKSKVTKWKTMNSDVYLECLRILSFKYSKPLPPVDWCFLQELIHEKAARKYCIRIAAHQVILSGTARRLIENYILALTDDAKLNTEIILIYKCFVYLSNSIQPMIVKPFVTSTLELAIAEFQAGFEENLIVILDHIKHVLEDNTVSEVNKVVFAEEIVNKLHALDYKSKVFDVLISCAHAIPLEKLNTISSPFQFVTLNPQILEKCLKIRCIAAVNNTTNPFIYLDVFIECPNIKIDLDSSSSKNLSFRVLYDWLRLVFLKHQNHTKTIAWLIELMAKIQLELAENQDFQTVLFKCSVFIIAVCILSGMDIFKSNFQSFKEYSSCFPYAVCSILKLEKWTTYSSQVLEWLYDVSTNKTYKRPAESEHILHIFKMSLLTSRNENAFNEKLKWMKFIEIDV